MTGAFCFLNLLCKILIGSVALFFNDHFLYLVYLHGLMVLFLQKCSKNQILQSFFADTDETIVYVFLKFFSNQTNISLLYFSHIVG